MIILYIVISNSDSLKLKHFNILHTYTKYSLLFDCRCSYVALPYFRFWYLPGKATIFGRISAVTQKYFNALPCFSRDIYSTLSMKCTYFSFYHYVLCLNAKLINSMQNITLCLFTITRLKVLLITERWVFV